MIEADERTERLSSLQPKLGLDRPTARWIRLATVAALCLLVILSAAVRWRGLQVPDGRLSTDEARVALSAVAVRDSGLPRLPSGRIYLRALLNSYAIAPVFALLGRHDYTARLPSLVAGVLLVPLVFLLARLLARSALAWPSDWPPTLAGFAAASFVAFAEPLVEWSRNAWPPSSFLLAYTAGVYCCYRGFVLRQASWQIGGALLFVLGLFTYEFAVLLPAGVMVYLACCLLLKDRSWFRGRPTLLALAILLLGLCLFVASALTLRAGTVAGQMSEVQTFVRPAFDLRGLGTYRQQVLGEYLALAGLCLLSFPFLARRSPRGAAFFGAMLLVALAVPVLVIQVHQTTRYILQALPLLGVIAAAGGVVTASDLASRLADGRLGLSLTVLRGAAYLLVLLCFSWALAGDASGVLRRWQQAPSRTTWLQDLRREDLPPGSLVLTDAPTILSFYGFPPAYYVHDREYARYAYRADDGLRSIYTDSLLLRESGDFERLLATSLSGETLWVVGRLGRLDTWIKQSAPGRWEQLVQRADRKVETRDGWILLRIKL